MTTWQDIGTAPRDGSFVLLHVPEGLDMPVTVGMFFREELRGEDGRFKPGLWFPADWSGWLATDGDNSPSWCNPTHWAPLPSPPSKEGE